LIRFEDTVDGKAAQTREAPHMGNEAGGLLMRRPLAYADRWWRTDDGLRLYARDYPASAGRVRLPVICLHGLTRNSADFEDIAPQIAAMDRRVVVPDFRGRGLSEADPDPMNYHLWTYAKDVLDLCDALGIGKALFIGTSMGGLVSMVLSTLRPNLIASAVLNDVGPVLSSKGLARISESAILERATFRNWHDAAGFVADQNRSAFPKLGQPDWLRFARRMFVKGRDGHLRPAFDPRITEAFRGLTVTTSAYDLAPCYASLAAGRRILLLRGALSDVLEADEANRMGSSSPNFLRVDIEHVGHAPTLSEPAALASLIEFLESQG